jgi:hypothetical protein
LLQEGCERNWRCVVMLEGLPSAICPRQCRAVALARVPAAELAPCPPTCAAPSARQTAILPIARSGPASPSTTSALGCRQRVAYCSSRAELRPRAALPAMCHRARAGRSATYWSRHCPTIPGQHSADLLPHGQSARLFSPATRPDNPGSGNASRAPHHCGQGRRYLCALRNQLVADANEQLFERTLEGVRHLAEGGLPFANFH